MPMFNPQDINYGNAAVNNYIQSNQSGNTMGGGVSPQSNGFGGIGFNMDTLKLGLGGIQTLGNLWNAWQAQTLARDQFDYTKGITDTNLGNQIKSYNTSLEDRIRARTIQENASQSSAEDYIARNRLTR